ncbi:lipoprotein Omp10 [Fulvimarina pelagi HTCC2506]|uniref:Lipoprotein Omp10 n=1 Tax=Fulvimarina pelagi HTCC2506 TaxID=314231 RepID=Q0G0T2_9HYPH|nr:hypothetical protein [Fulvimarina pelagi]EAU40907.1 lipoprotein Omp10 [Fulvimarina pelagi HTCC2506]
MRRIALSAALVSTLFVTACQLGGQEDLGPRGPQGIEGLWNSVGGSVNYTASFNSGRFTSTEQGTGAVLAQGTYSNLGPGQISIVYSPTTRDTQVAANCNQTAVNTLSCATSSGNRFQLQRA